MKIKKLKSLLQNKQKTISRTSGHPSLSSGKDGDLQIRRIDGQGIFLFYKWNNKWYSTRLSQHRHTTAEHKDPVKIPLGVEPASLGSIAMGSDGLIKVRKAKSDKSQLVAMNTSKVLDIKEVRLERAETTDMDDDNSKTPDWVIENTGHVHLQLHNPSPNALSEFDTYISFSRLHPEGSFNLRRWIMGYDTSEGDFVWNYKSASTSLSTRDYVVDTPSTTANMKMKLTATGALTIANSMHIGSVAAITSDTDKFLVLDGTEVKYVTGDTLIPDILTAGTNCSFSGSTLNVDDAFIKNDADDTMAGTLAITSTTADQFKVLYDASNYALLNVSATGDLEIETIGAGSTDSDITLNADGGINLNTDGNNDVTITDGSTTHFKFDASETQFIIYDDTVAADLFKIQVDDDGVTTISTSDYSSTDANLILAPDGTLDLQLLTNGVILTKGSNKVDYGKFVVGTNGDVVFSTVDANAEAAHMTLAPDGDLILDPVSTRVIINATDALYLDGGGDTKIFEHSADYVRFVVGDEILMSLDENGGDGNQVMFVDASVGFTQIEPTYDATNTVVDFRFSNKQFLTFDGGDITSIRFYFPVMSGNFVMLIKQDGTGSRTITNYKVYEFDESLADGSGVLKFAGGSNPTLTTDANHVDIISIYWDADNEIAYGVASLDFQF